MEEFGDELLFCDRYVYPYVSQYSPREPRPYRAGFLLDQNAHNPFHDLLLVVDFDGTAYSPYEVELSQFMLCIDEDLAPESVDKLKRDWPLKPHVKRENFLNRVIRGYAKRILPFDGGPGPFFTKREKRAYLHEHYGIHEEAGKMGESPSQMLLRMHGLEGVEGRFLRMQS